MLTISKLNQDVLVGELIFVAVNMRETARPGDKLYLMTAAYGVMHRAFNIEFDQELLIAHQVIQQAYQQINGRVSNPAITTLNAELVGAILDGIADAIEALADRWQNSQEIHDLLSRVALLGYAATGNGAYLYFKGALSL